MAKIIRGQDPFAGGTVSALSVRDPLDFITPLFGRVFGSVDNAGPRLDVKESEQGYVLEMEIPGVDKNAITVSVYNDTVTVEAEVRQENDANTEYKWLHRERNFGKISRTIALPEEVDEDTANARFENGVLQLTLPKKRSSAAKRLTVQ